MKFETSENLPKYFKTIQKSTPLSVAEEGQLILDIQRGDASATHALVKANLKFVVKVANRHRGQGVPLDDLIQEGNIGLLEAAQAFQPRNGQRFINYAQLWIRKRINETVAKTGRIVRLPHNQEYEIFKSKRKGEEVEAPTRVSIDKPVGEDGDTTLGDLILTTGSEVEFAMEMDSIRFKVKQALTVLKERDRGIIMDYFGINREYEVPTDMIAEKYSMTSVRVCQIVKASVEKMKLTVI
jgi:RNA polymerase primary sigma factor